MITLNEIKLNKKTKFYNFNFYEKIKKTLCSYKNRIFLKKVRQEFTHYIICAHMHT